ncbi:MAG TPA: helix-turn-helix transcriptional regulator [Acidobacteriota bacterium]|jgi:transcriptional regulator with XRE-family HTH domain|nr:helix-turn-helix transcriptional regulator [Acidobacteriota bacterium]
MEKKETAGIDELEERVRLNLRTFRKRKGMSQKEFCEALGWGYHILPDLESGKVKWSLARVNQVSKYFQCPPDYFLMGDEVAEEKTGMLRMLYTMEPEKRKSLRRIIYDWNMTDYKVIEEILKFARRFFQAGRYSVKRDKIQ